MGGLLRARSLELSAAVAFFGAEAARLASQGARGAPGGVSVDSMGGIVFTNGTSLPPFSGMEIEAHLPPEAFRCQGAIVAGVRLPGRCDKKDHVFDVRPNPKPQFQPIEMYVDEADGTSQFLLFPPVPNLSSGWRLLYSRARAPGDSTNWAEQRFFRVGYGEHPCAREEHGELAADTDALAAAAEGPIAPAVAPAARAEPRVAVWESQAGGAVEAQDARGLGEDDAAGGKACKERSERHKRKRRDKKEMKKSTTRRMRRRMATLEQDAKVEDRNEDQAEVEMAGEDAEQREGDEDESFGSEMEEQEDLGQDSIEDAERQVGAGQYDIEDALEQEGMDQDGIEEQEDMDQHGIQDAEGQEGVENAEAQEGVDQADIEDAEREEGADQDDTEDAQEQQGMDQGGIEDVEEQEDMDDDGIEDAEEQDEAADEGSPAEAGTGEDEAFGSTPPEHAQERAPADGAAGAPEGGVVRRFAKALWGMVFRQGDA